MNEQRSDVQTKPQPIDKKDQKPIGHGDKMGGAVEKAAAKSGAKSPDELKGDEIME